MIKTIEEFSTFLNYSIYNKNETQTYINNYNYFIL